VYYDLEDEYELLQAWLSQSPGRGALLESWLEIWSRNPYGVDHIVLRPQMSDTLTIEYFLPEYTPDSVFLVVVDQAGFGTLIHIRPADPADTL
jgi:hypothetical protein